MNIDPLAAAVIAGLVALCVQLIGLWVNRRSGLTQAQMQYQSSMESWTKTLDQRIVDITHQKEDLEEEIERLEITIRQLRSENRDLMAENLDLRRRESHDRTSN